MLPLSSTLRLLSGTLRSQIAPRATIASKPAKHVLTPLEQVIGLGAMFVTFLVPSGWILAHLEDYKHRPQE